MSLLWAHLFTVTSVVSTLLAVAVLLQQRRSPQSAIAWILAIVALPYLVIPLFIALGFRKQQKRRRPISFTELSASSAASIPPDAAAMEQLLMRFGVPQATSGNEFNLHSSAAEAHATLSQVLDSAVATVDASFYALDNDDAGKWFVERLTEKLREGIAVRLALDRWGTLQRPAEALRRFRQAGGQLRFYSPFLPSPGSSHINLRNHRKCVIADGAWVWAGGRNIGDGYLTGAASNRPWVDLSFALRGPAVQTFNDIFASDWGMVGRESVLPLRAPAEATGKASAQLLPSGPDMPSDALHDSLVDAIYRARQRVWISTPYFLPTEAMRHALATAASKGIDVRITIPETSNHRITDLARGAYLRDLASAGCRFLRFQPGMLHAKAGIVDNLAWTGSANFDARSMLFNFEAVLILFDSTPIERWFAEIEKQCATGIGEAGKLRRLGESAFYLLAPLL